MVKPHGVLDKELGIKAVFCLTPLPQRPCVGESPCRLGGGVEPSNHQFPGQTDRSQDTEGHHSTAEASRLAHTGTDSGRLLAVHYRQLGFQPGALRISATGTITDTRYHRHNLYLTTGSTGPYVLECTRRLWSPPYVGSRPLWRPSVALYWSSGTVWTCTWQSSV